MKEQTNLIEENDLQHCNECGLVYWSKVLERKVEGEIYYDTEWKCSCGERNEFRIKE